MDTNGDDLWDVLRVGVGVTLTQTGDYTLNGDLRAVDGAPPGSALAVISGTGGTVLTATLEFAPDLLVEHGGAGPLVLEAVSLFVQEQPFPIVTANDVYTTSPYTAADFAGWEVRQVGTEIIDQGVDMDGNGLFNSLDLEWPLEVRRAGVYTVTALLTLRPELPQLETLSLFNLTGDVGVFTATLRFHGRSIGLSGADGPYTVTSLLVEGPLGIALVEPLLGATQPYTYMQFEGGAEACVEPLTNITLSGPINGYTGTDYTFTGTLTPFAPTQPLTLTWTPTPLSGQNTLTATYRWPTPGVYTITLRAENCGGAITTTHVITVAAPLPVCPHPLTDVAIAGPLNITGSLYIGSFYTFRADITPANATPPITYTWLPVPTPGVVAIYRWATPGVYTITLRAENCGGLVTATRQITVYEVERYRIYLPLVLRTASSARR